MKRRMFLLLFTGVFLAALTFASHSARANDLLVLDCLSSCFHPWLCPIGGLVESYSIVVDVMAGTATVSNSKAAVNTYASSDADAVYLWLGNALRGRINRITGTGLLNLKGQPNDLQCFVSGRMF
jgi:hypothetical protein